jgi:hypothetical protein
MKTLTMEQIPITTEPKVELVKTFPESEGWIEEKDLGQGSEHNLNRHTSNNGGIIPRKIFVIPIFWYEAAGLHHEK